MLTSPGGVAPSTPRLSRPAGPMAKSAIISNTPTVAGSAR